MRVQLNFSPTTLSIKAFFNLPRAIFSTSSRVNRVHGNEKIDYFSP
jgi:hypothetical protein